MAPKISLITPVFNEPRIHENLPVINQELEHTGFDYEIIAVNDGSDAVTTTRLNTVSLPSLRILIYAPNKGKGFALRYGFEQATGDLICFMDADLQLHPHQIALFTSLLNLLQADIVIGSKRHPLSKVDYSPRRRLYSWAYHQLIRLFFNLKVTDTQVGLKLFRRHVLEAVMPRLVVKAFAFDLELLVVANRLGYTKILEAPIHLTWKPGSSTINWRVIPGMILDTVAIFYRSYILHHYDKLPLRQTFEGIEPLNHKEELPISASEEPTLPEIPLPAQENEIKGGIIFAARERSRL